MQTVIVASNFYQACDMLFKITSACFGRLPPEMEGQFNE